MPQASLRLLTFQGVCVYFREEYLRFLILGGVGFFFVKQVKWGKGHKDWPVSTLLRWMERGGEKGACFKRVTYLEVNSPLARLASVGSGNHCLSLTNSVPQWRGLLPRLFAIMLFSIPYLVVITLSAYPLAHVYPVIFLAIGLH